MILSHLLTMYLRRNWRYGKNSFAGFLTGTFNLRWPNLNRKEPAAEDLYREARNNVQRNWLYWRPIVYGKVTISSTEYDEMPPMFMIEINAAMDERADREKEAFENAKRENSEQ